MIVAADGAIWQRQDHAAGRAGWPQDGREDLRQHPVCRRSPHQHVPAQIHWLRRAVRCVLLPHALSLRHLLQQHLHMAHPDMSSAPRACLRMPACHHARGLLMQASSQSNMSAQGSVWRPLHM